MASFSYENKRGSGKKLKVHFDIPEDEDYPNDHQKHSTSSISSQSSLDSDDTDKDETSIDNFESKYSSGYGSPVWSFQSGSTTQSPPLQQMSPSGYDPNRIPSSVFSARPTSPMEWSVASNESLFSLHLGNNSFSRDHAFIFSNNKSGELPRTNDLVTTLPPVQEVSSSNNNNNEKNVEKERHSLSSSDTSEDETEDLALEIEHIRTSNETADLAVKDDDHGKTETLAEVETNALDKTETHTDDHNHSKAAVVPSEEPKNYTTSVSYRSVESDMSNRSFQFPILTADGVRTSSETIKSEKQEKNEKQHQQQKQQPEKPVQPPSRPKTETAPKHSGRNWCCCSCFFCSPCF